MDERFDLVALSWLFRVEGGDSDDPSDPGGATRFGVSFSYLKGLGELGGGDIDGDGDVDRDDIRALDRATAAELYRRDFWRPCQCDALPPPLDLMVFDGAVNQGVATTGRLLQSCLGRRVKVDGVIGPQTLAVVRAHRVEDLAPDFLSRRAQHYHDIARSNSALERFIRGWLRRLFLLSQEVSRAQPA